MVQWAKPGAFCLMRGLFFCLGVMWQNLTSFCETSPSGYRVSILSDENGGGTGGGYALAVCVRGASLMRCCRRSSGHVILACPSTRSLDTTMRCSTPHHYQRRQPCQSLGRQYCPCSSWSPSS